MSWPESDGFKEGDIVNFLPKNMHRHSHWGFLPNVDYEIVRDYRGDLGLKGKTARKGIISQSCLKNWGKWELVLVDFTLENE